MAGFYIIFLIAGHAAPVAVLCGISAALLQYFMLVYFGWTTAEAVYLYINLVEVLGANIARYVLKAALIVWCKSLKKYLLKITYREVSSDSVRKSVKLEWLSI